MNYNNGKLTISDNTKTINVECDVTAYATNDYRFFFKSNFAHSFVSKGIDGTEPEIFPDVNY